MRFSLKFPFKADKSVLRSNADGKNLLKKVEIFCESHDTITVK